jgi:hypothetical protein
MALPRRLFIPEGVHDLPTAVPARTFQAGPWAGATSPAEPLTGGAATAAHLGSPRRRRRAVLPGEDGRPDRPVLVEWFPSDELDEQAAAEVRGLCHVHLLRLYQVGLADTRTAFAISEAPLGVDLGTVLRASKEPLPLWWILRVMSAAASGLLALHQHLVRRGPGRGHGGLGLSTLFVSGSGAVQLLGFVPHRRTLVPLVTEEILAPELRVSPRLLSPAADVFALGAVLRELLTPAQRGRGGIGRLLARCLSPHPEQRPVLPSVLRTLQELALEVALEQGPLTEAAVGEIVTKRCPSASDLPEHEGPEAAVPGLPALTRSLRALSSPTLSTSGSWALAADEPPAPSLPVRRPSRGAVSAVLALAALAGGAVAAGTALWSSAAPTPAEARSAVAAPAQPASTTSSRPPAPPGRLDDGLPLRTGASAESPGLRVRLLELRPVDGSLSLQLRLTNPTPQQAVVDLSALRLVPTGAGEARAPLAAPSSVELGGGREQLVRLTFAAPSVPLESLRLRLGSPD